ncbi:hypothetical protein HPB51_025623 [Rhipicephalus microplus]|uniref:Uncharacterized protein n=1 Tax=Rhipicephalus microplus TaxID=6941 RepID=A0A9J6D7U3_RHIMP|nr:hypothetical protein HPB51_025623 [Rhipicephalus microplus]
MVEPAKSMLKESNSGCPQLCLQVKWVSKTWAQQADLPSHVVTMLNNFPSHVHPMSQLSCAITACNTESKFVQAYNKGVPKATYWEVSMLWSKSIAR